MSTKNSIPLGAKRVFVGEIFEVWQWKQKMFDGSTEIFEKLKRPNTARIIPIVGNKILMQFEEQPCKRRGSLSLPGGRFNKGETALKAAKRELLEETGYASKDWMLWKSVCPVSKIDWMVYTYIARNCVMKQNPHLDAGERIKTKLVSFEEFLEIIAKDAKFYGVEIIKEVFLMKCTRARKKEFHKLLFKR